jgi:hypothetical protein
LIFSQNLGYRSCVTLFICVIITPAAFVRLKSIGLPKDCCTEFSEKICGFIDQEISRQPPYIFHDIFIIGAVLRHAVRHLVVTGQKKGNPNNF